MASPDPLDESTILPPSLAPWSASRRVSRSPQRRSLLASPRKQTSALQVGHSQSPQRLLVTVETEADDDMASASSGTRRKLFKSPVQSPAGRRRADDTVTTTVPLRESVEDELTAALTPSRRRSRTRLANGTPLPTAGVKRRAGSPISRNPRRIRNEKFGENTTELHFDEKENVQTTPPTAVKRGRPPKTQVVQPSSELGNVQSTPPTAVKRGRPPKIQAAQPSSELGPAKRGRRRQAMAPDELVGIAEEAAAERSVQSIRRPRETGAVDLGRPVSRQRAGSASINNNDDEPTPKASVRRSTRHSPSKKRPFEAAGARNTDRAAETSDHSVDDFSSQTNDTIAQGEDFSMIFMDSLLSLQGNHDTSIARDDDELGDDTHLIINNTLESLRREVAQASDPVDITEAISIPDVPEIEEESEKEVEFIPIIREAARNARLSESPWWSRKPKKMPGSSPSKHQMTLLRSAAKRSGRLFKFDQREEEPTPTKSGKRPASAQSTRSAQSREDRSRVYEDSFSEIPQNYLNAPSLKAAAAPKPLNFAATRTEREVDLMEYGLQGEEEEAAEEEEALHAEEPVEDDADDDIDEHATEDAEEDAEEVQATSHFRGAAGPRTIRLPTPPSPDTISSPVRDVVEEDEHGEQEELEQHEEQEAFEEYGEQGDFEEHAEQEELALEEQEDFAKHTGQEKSALEEQEEFEPEEQEVFAKQEEPEEDMQLGLELGGEEEREEEYPDQEEQEEEMEEREGDVEGEAEVEDFEEDRLQEDDDEEAEHLEEELEQGEELQEEGEHYAEHEDDQPELADQEEHEFDEDEGNELEEHEDYGEHEEHEEPGGHSYEPLDRLRGDPFARRQPVYKASYADEEMRSDPAEQPEQLEPTPEYEAQPVNATPLHQMSSPLQDPRSVPQEPVQYPALRPALSSIMRAGRVLQTVTSDPPSPGDREKHLGSPFRSSASKESSQGPREDRPPFSSKSPPQMFHFGHDQSTVSKAPVNPRIAASNDIFGMRFGGARQTLDMGAKEPLHRKQPSRESVESSLGTTPQGGGAMNWFDREGPISPIVKGVSSLLQATRFSSMRSAIPLGQIDGVGEELDETEDEDEQTQDEDEVEEQEEEQEEEQHQEEEEELEGLGGQEQDELEKQEIELEGQEQENEPQEEQGVEEEEEEDDDDDDDIDLWEYAARREVPPRPEPRQPLAPLTQTRGMALDSLSSRTGTQQARAPIATVTSPEDPSKSSRIKQVVSQQANESFAGEEHSLVSGGQSEEEPASASKSKRFDLSSFFSSPAAIPGLLAEKFMSAKTKTPAEPTVQQLEPAGPQQEPPISTASIFSRLSANGKGPRNSRRTEPVSSLARSAPLVNEPVAEQNSFPPAEDPHLPVIAQKQNFTPRTKQTSDAFFQPSSAVTPPRMQLTHEDIQRWQQETSNASETSPTLRASLRPLPSKHASPKKSSLRSPMKPHTPGRVVEFTSSVLSPGEQSLIREQRGRANEGVSEEEIRAAAVVPPRAEPRAGKGSMARQQRQPQNLAPRIISPAGVSKKRSAKKRAHRGPPSETVWSRRHWIFLDTLLQMRRQSPFSEAYEPVSRRYLGKVVTSMGESLVLEKWHLECVDAFKSQIGGWDEGELAKRLFALILGEAQRRRSSVDPSPGVMFH